jgi:hypothetical protein
MAYIYLNDGTSIWFDQDKYKLSFENMNILLFRKPEFKNNNRPRQITINYQTKTYGLIYDGGDETYGNFTGLM